MKMCAKSGQEFVIGGYTPKPKNFDALIIDYYQDGLLMYTARTMGMNSPARGRSGQLRRRTVTEVAFNNLHQCRRAVLCRVHGRPVLRRQRVKPAVKRHCAVSRNCKAW